MIILSSQLNNNVFFKSCAEELLLVDVLQYVQYMIMGVPDEHWLIRKQKHGDLFDSGSKLVIQCCTPREILDGNAVMTCDYSLANRNSSWNEMIISATPLINSYLAAMFTTYVAQTNDVYILNNDVLFLSVASGCSQ